MFKEVSGLRRFRVSGLQAYAVLEVLDLCCFRVSGLGRFRCYGVSCVDHVRVCSGGYEARRSSPPRTRALTFQRFRRVSFAEFIGWCLLGSGLCCFIRLFKKIYFQLSALNQAAHPAGCPCLFQLIHDSIGFWLYALWLSHYSLLLPNTQLPEHSYFPYQIYKIRFFFYGWWREECRYRQENVSTSASCDYSA